MRGVPIVEEGVNRFGAEASVGEENHSELESGLGFWTLQYSKNQKSKVVPPTETSPPLVRNASTKK